MIHVWLGSLAHLQDRLSQLATSSLHSINNCIGYSNYKFFLGAAAGSPYIVFISTSGMLRSSDIYYIYIIYIYIYIYIYIICVPTRNRNT